MKKSLLKNPLFWLILLVPLSAVILKLDGVLLRNYEFFIIPYFWIELCLFVVIILAFFCVFKHKLFFAYISIIPLCLCIGEIWGYFHQPQSTNKCQMQSFGNYNTDYVARDFITGYKANPNTKAQSKRMSGDEVIYDVIYESGENGYRKTPNSNANSQKCIVLFGDSFTTGEGVQGDETLGFYLNEYLKHSHKIINLGFHGYGPHQALALLQSTAVQEQTNDCQKIIAFYESIPQHIERANGFSPWEDRNAPRFRLSDGKIEWINKEKNLWSKLKNKLFYQLKKSYFFMYLQPRYKPKKAYNDLYFGILSEMDKTLQEQLGTRLHFILIDSHNLSDEREKQDERAIKEWLKNQDFPYFFASSMINDFATNRLKYAIHACDLHPNALMNSLLAKSLAQFIESSADSGVLDSTHLESNSRISQ